MEVRCKKGINITKNIIQCWIIVSLFCLVVSCETKEETKRISIEVHEGTELAFDLSPDGQTIVFDLLGQIWLLPAEGGEARAITDSVKEYAEHLFPTFVADGKRIVFWEARQESWGLTSMNLSGEERQILTKLSSSIYDSFNDQFYAYSPSKKKIALVRGSKLLLINEAEYESPVEPKIEGLLPEGITDPAWAPDGNHLALVNVEADYMSHDGGRLFQVKAEGGTAEPFTHEKSEVRAPAYSPDGQNIAYFIRNEELAFELWIQKLDGSETRKLVEHDHITPLRLRWSPEGSDLLYCAEGCIWRISVEGGDPQGIPFTARLSFSQKQAKLKPVQFPKAGQNQSARGHMGLVLSPDGRKIAAIALGRLWAWQAGEKPEVVVKLPLSATGLCWSPDSTEVAWSAGYTGIEDLFATNIQTGNTRRLTAIPGTEVKASWSPDGKYIAFMHLKSHMHNTTLRAFELNKTPIIDLYETIELGPGSVSVLWPGAAYYGRPWSPDSKGLLGEEKGRPTLISLDGEVRQLTNFVEIPRSLRAFIWEKDGSILYQTNHMLWRFPFDTQLGIHTDAVPVSQDPATYPSAASDGSVLYISADGWRLRRPAGEVKHLGWPISYEIPGAPDSIIIRNVSIIDGTGSAITKSRDILIEEGRIARIVPHGGIRSNRKSTVIEGDGRTVIPGLIDAHVHVWDQVLLPELLYEGITTVRDMGSQLAWVKGFQDLVEAGIQAGPRIVLGGFQLGPSLIPSSQPIGNTHGEDAFIRVLSLAQAFEIGFIKMFWPINPYSGARFIEMAHELGFPISSHFGYPLPLVAAGIDSKEHLIGWDGATGPRFGGVHCGVFYDDIIQLTKGSGMSIVPTIDISPRSLAADHEKSILEEAKTSPFLNDRLDSFMPRSRPFAKQRRDKKNTLIGRENLARFYKAGVFLAAGTDYPFYWIPWMLHRELEEYVRAGMSPLEAIMTATRNAAHLLRAENDTGTIEEGKLADLLILNANPLEDIRNTRKIWKVIQGGKVVDRDALKNWLKCEAEEVANIGK